MRVPEARAKRAEEALRGLSEAVDDASVILCDERECAGECVREANKRARRALGGKEAT